MSTNYYALKKEPTLYDRTIHIGKSSAGWLFLFEDNNEFHTYPQFKRWLDNNIDTGEYVLFDEYNHRISKEELLKIIDKKQNDPHCRSNPDNFKCNKNIDGYRFSMDEFC